MPQDVSPWLHPHIDDKDAEAGLLAALMLRPDRLPQIRQWIDPDDFHWRLHRQVYETILELDDRQEPPTVERVVDTMQRRVALGVVGKYETDVEQAGGDDLALAMAEKDYERGLAARYQETLVPLADMVGSAPVGSPVLFARHVLDASVRRETEQVGLELQSIGRDGLGDTVDLIDRRIEPALERLREQRERVTAADEVWMATPDEPFDVQFDAEQRQERVRERDAADLDVAL